MKGNSNGNINNGGFVSKAGDWIIYSNFNDNNYLYKMKFDGSMKIKLAEIRCKYINTLYDWVYYTDYAGINIYKTNIHDFLYDEVCGNINNLITVDHYMYWAENYGEALYRMDLGNCKKHLMRNRISYNLNIDGGWAFYIKEENNKNKNKLVLDRFYVGDSNLLIDYVISKFSFKIKKKLLTISNPISNLIVEEAVAYYISEDGIYKTTLINGKSVKLSENKSRVFNILGNYLFYINSNDNFKLYRINLISKSESKFSNINNIKAINIIDSKIYFYVMTIEDNLVLYSVETEGGEVIII